MDYRITLPKVKESDVFDFMESDTISRLHLGKDALPFLWYKKSLQMIKCGMYKHMSAKDYDIILAYCMATRKQRRELPYFRKSYLLVIRRLYLEAEIDRKDKIIDKLNKLNEKSRMLR